jgi:hypothetical protein
VVQLAALNIADQRSDRFHIATSAALSAAVRWEWIKTNPAMATKKPRQAALALRSLRSETSPVVMLGERPQRRQLKTAGLRDASSSARIAAVVRLG